MRAPLEMPSWKTFVGNSNGNLTLTFCLISSVLVASIGAGLDYSSAVATRQSMQDAIDAAVIAAATKGTTLDTAYAKAVFQSNGVSFTYETDLALKTTSWTNIDGINFSTDSSGNIVGTAHGKMKTSLLAIAGISTIDISVKSKAKGTDIKKISTATFKIKSAQGAFDKDIYFYTRDANGTILSNTLILQYDYTLSNGNGTKKFTPATTSSTTVTVGDYASYGYKMIVYEDLTYTGKHTSPVTHYSDDADAAKWTKVTGACTDTAGATNNWEDGGDSNFLDFVFTLTCAEGSSGSKNVRLVE